MDDPSQGGGDPSLHHRRFQFGLGKLFLVTTLAALLGAGWAALKQLAGPAAWDFPQLAAVVLLVLAGPPTALILASLFRSAIERLRDRR